MNVQTASNRQLRLIKADMEEGIAELSATHPQRPRDIGRKRVRIRFMNAVLVMIQEEQERRKQKSHTND